ncbi:EpsG family protein [Tetragenococcus halophilus]
MLLHIGIIVLFFLLGTFINDSKLKNGNKIYLFITFFVLYIMSAFRSINIGNDTRDYFLMYENFGRTDNILSMPSDIEVGYRVLNKFLYSLNPSPVLLTSITSLFVLGSIFFFIYKNSEIPWLSVMLFINLRTFYFTLSGIRQSIALAIILISYKYLKQGNFWKFVSLVILASTFHTSSLLFLIIYPMSRMRVKQKIIALYFGVSVVFFFILERILPLILNFIPKYQSYLSSSYFESVKLASILNFLVSFSILLFGFFVLKYVKSKRKVNNELGILSVNSNLLLHIMLLSTAFNFIAINGSIIKRAGLYFSVFAIIYIPNLIKKIKDKNIKILIIYLILVLSLAYNLVILIYRPEWQRVYPYELFWDVF